MTEKIMESDSSSIKYDSLDEPSVLRGSIIDGLVELDNHNPQRSYVERVLPGGSLGKSTNALLIDVEDPLLARGAFPDSVEVDAGTLIYEHLQGKSIPLDQQERIFREFITENAHDPLRVRGVIELIDAKAATKGYVKDVVGSDFIDSRLLQLESPQPSHRPGLELPYQAETLLAMEPELVPRGGAWGKSKNSQQMTANDTLERMVPKSSLIDLEDPLLARGAFPDSVEEIGRAHV